jgi:hypothetical protein
VMLGVAARLNGGLQFLAGEGGREGGREEERVIERLSGGDGRLRGKRHSVWTTPSDGFRRIADCLRCERTVSPLGKSGGDV